MGKENVKVLEEKEIEKSKECFVIMPIGDKEGYPKGHFKRIYEDIFKPAIINAGFEPYRADDSNASHLIQIDIVKRIIEAPIAICDLSTRNPNVLFELGIRQAFDRPVVLVQEVGTERIFDINSINTYEYRKERIYNEVLEDQEKIELMLKDTYEKHSKGECINSLIRLLKMEPAIYNSNVKVDSDEMIKVIFNEIIGLKREFNKRDSNSINSEKYLSTVELFSKKAADIINEFNQFEAQSSLFKKSDFNDFNLNLKIKINQCKSLYSSIPGEYYNMITEDLYNKIIDIDMITRKRIAEFRHKVSESSAITNLLE